MANLKELIQQAVKEIIPVQTYLCKVKDVDKTGCTIDAEPVNENADMLEVRLKAVITGNDKGLIVFPKKNSYVLVSIIGNNINSAFVSMVEEVESAKLTIASNELILDKDTAKVKWKQVEFNGGNNKGLVLVVPLLKILVSIIKEINTLKTVFKAWVVAPQDGGAALKGGAATWYGTQMPVPQQSDIENKKITH